MENSEIYPWASLLRISAKEGGGFVTLAQDTPILWRRTYKDPVEDDHLLVTLPRRLPITRCTERTLRRSPRLVIPNSPAPAANARRLVRQVP